MKKFKSLLCLTLAVLMILSAATTVVFATPDTLPFQISANGALYTEITLQTVEIGFMDDVKEVPLYILPSDGYTLTVYAAPKEQCPVERHKSGAYYIYLSQKQTNLYLKLEANEVATFYTVKLISARTPTIYNDEINISAWALPYINYCNNEGMAIIQGDQNGNASPLVNITRYEIAAVAARFLGLDCYKFTNNEQIFADELINWAKPSVHALYGLGIISGHKEGKKYYYRGNDKVTRQEVAVIMSNMLMLQQGSELSAKEFYLQNQEAFNKGLKKFADVESIANWAKPYMALAVTHFGFYSGSKKGGKTYLLPTQHITREEMIAVVARELEFDIDTMLAEVIYDGSLLIKKINKVPAALRDYLKAAYDAALNAQRGNSESKKNNAYSKLFIATNLINNPPLIYLSPSRQMANQYTGVNTNEGAQMQGIAAKLSPMLTQMGFRVYTANVNTDLYARADEAKKLGANMYVSIHSNATGIKNQGNWQGSIIFHSNNPGSQILAEKVNRRLSAVTPTKDSGIVNDGNTYNPYIEIKQPIMANILAEVEYHDYPAYANWIVANKSKIAQAFADAILEYYLRY